MLLKLGTQLHTMLYYMLKTCQKARNIVQADSQTVFLYLNILIWGTLLGLITCTSKSVSTAAKNTEPPCFQLETKWALMLRFKLMKMKREHLKSLDRYPKPRSVLVPNVDEWRLCWDYNKDAKAIIQSLTNVVPFREQMGPRVWVGKQAEYPSPSWLEKTRINGMRRHCQGSQHYI